MTRWVGPSEDDPIPITGVLKGGRLLTENGDKMAGTIYTDKEKIEFVKSTP